MEWFAPMIFSTIDGVRVLSVIHSELSRIASEVIVIFPPLQVAKNLTRTIQSLYYAPAGRYINAWMLYTAPSIGTIAGWGLTRIILRPLSALSLDNIVKRNITTGLFGLDEGLNALSCKNPSAAGWFSRPIKCPILAHISNFLYFRL